MSNKIKGLFLILLATFGAGFFSIPYRLSLETVDPLTVVWGIFLWAFLFSLPGVWIVRKQIKFSLKIGWLTMATSLAGLLGNYSACQALAQNSPTLFNLVCRSEIIFAMILSWFFLKEFINIRVWIALILIILGIFVMKIDSLNFELNDWSAFLWAILTALSFSVMLVLAKNPLGPVQINEKVVPLLPVILTSIIPSLAPRQLISVLLKDKDAQYVQEPSSVLANEL